MGLFSDKTMKRLYRKSWIEKVKAFQSLPASEQNEYCGYCGCEGGCNLCENISKIKEEDIIDDTKFTPKNYSPAGHIDPLYNN